MAAVVWVSIVVLVVCVAHWDVLSNRVHTAGTGNGLCWGAFAFSHLPPCSGLHGVSAPSSADAADRCSARVSPSCTNPIDCSVYLVFPLPCWRGRVLVPKAHTAPHRDLHTSSTSARVCVRVCDRLPVQGLPVRESLQVMYKINRDKTVIEALLFCVWCIVFYLIVNAVNEVQVVFTTNDALNGALLQQQWPGYVPAWNFKIL